MNQHRLLFEVDRVASRFRLLRFWQGLAAAWLIAGGESGRGHRPCRAEWLRDLRDRCEEAGVAFFFKQWGGPRSKSGGRRLDGREHSEMPHACAAQNLPLGISNKFLTDRGNIEHIALMEELLEAYAGHIATFYGLFWLRNYYAENIHHIA